jgi:cell division protein FtsI (penicillin-binding protein 3)
MKPFLVAAAIEEEVVKSGEIIYCENGRYRVADRVFHDTKKHGWLSVPQILKYSSNIGSAKIGEKMGPARLYRYLKSFGFGERTMVDLPGEARGSLRHHSKWSAVTIDTVSFGQGISARYRRGRHRT